VKFIFNDAAGEDAARESTDAARKILDYLKQHGQCSRSDLLRKCFSGHLSSARLDDALDALLMDTPPAILMAEGDRMPENGKRKKSYTLNTGANLANLATLPAGVDSAPICEVTNLANLAKLDSARIDPSSLGSPSSQTGESAASRTNSAMSQSSPNSHGANECQIVRGVL
jgi:hypothetical protein